MARPESQHKKRDTSLDRAFGDALRAIRKRARLSQEELAHRAGYHRTYVGLLERAVYGPSLQAIFSLAGALAVKPYQIVKETERLWSRLHSKK